MSNTPVSRVWQEEAIFNIQSSWEEDIRNNINPRKILIAACPGSGKTFMASSVAIDKLKDSEVNLVIVVSPTVNIKAQWKAQFKRFGVDAIDDATNEAMRFRKVNGERLVGNYLVICITYAQLAKDRELFADLARRESPVMTIADEVHRADEDEAYGLSLESIAGESKYRLALSGTPFNSNGGSLAMCPWVQEDDADGNVIRKVIPNYSYDYSRAIADESCRPVEFLTIAGKGTQTYRRLLDKTVWKKVTDLASQNKTDSLGALLSGEGDFLEALISEGLKSLSIIKRHDSHAGMLIVAKDKDHGAKICELIYDLCKTNDLWGGYQVAEVYHDTPKAHDKIKSLERDRTDVIVTVRMISEGVDIKRLRVGVFATDYKTRMFFIQFVGRFVRWETRLDETQHSRIVIPAHAKLLEYAREIERMVQESEVKKDKEEVGGKIERKNELIGSSTERTDDGVVFRGKESKERYLANKFFSLYPSLQGKIPDFLAIIAAKEGSVDGDTKEKYQEKEIEVDWWKKNNKLVASIVRRMVVNGEEQGIYFSKVNKAANRYVGIKKVDTIVPVEIMKKRYEFLRMKIEAMDNGGSFDDEL